MSEIKRKHSKLLCSAMVCSVISSLSLMAAIMVNSEGKNKGFLIAFGLLFWVLLVFEQVLFWQANNAMKIAASKSKNRLRRRPGIISLPSNMEGLIVDIVFVLSLIAFTICIVFKLGETLMQFIFICLIVLTFRLHCFLNGRNYRYMKSKERKVDCKNG